MYLRRIDEPFHFEIFSPEGYTVETDASPEFGGKGQGLRPMQMFLGALVACSTIDVVHILKKQRQILEDIKVEIDGLRREDEIPAIFTHINMHFTVYGNIPDEKVAFAINRSIEKYCSVSKMIDQVVKITSTFKVIKPEL